MSKRTNISIYFRDIIFRILGLAEKSKTVWLLPCLTVLLLLAPLVGFHLPNYGSDINEEYQPLKTLAFLHSFGRDFHKWGPFDNFVFAPGYLLTLLYWKLTGSLGKVSEVFPYGFKDPLRQLSFLILESRLVGLTFCLLGVATFLSFLYDRTRTKAGTFLAGMFCIATNPIITGSFITLKQDGMMAICCGFAVLLYNDIVQKGLTRRRGLLFSTWVAWAVIAKEIAIPIFAIPYLGLAVHGLMKSRFDSNRRTQFYRDYSATVAALLAWYVLLDVIYAPGTWLRRIQFWVHGPGKDPAVWGAPHRTWVDYAFEIGRGFLDNFGPVGTPVVLLGVAAFLISRRQHKLLLLLPAISFLLLGIIPVGYVPAYFLIPAAMILAPLVASGLNVLIDNWGFLRHPAGAALIGSFVITNIWCANIVWIAPYQNTNVLVENYVVSHVGTKRTVNQFSFWTAPAGKSRLAFMGYQVDPRRIQDIRLNPAGRPDYIFVNQRFQRFLDECAVLPRRAAMIESESGFRFQDWQGTSALGYAEIQTLTPKLPAWYPFAFMPAAQALFTEKISVYRLAESPAKRPTSRPNDARLLATMGARRKSS